MPAPDLTAATTRIRDAALIEARRAHAQTQFKDHISAIFENAPQEMAGRLLIAAAAEANSTTEVGDFLRRLYVISRTHCDDFEGLAGLWELLADAAYSMSEDCAERADSAEDLA